MLLVAHLPTQYCAPPNLAEQNHPIGATTEAPVTNVRIAIRCRCFAACFTPSVYVRSFARFALLAGKYLSSWRSVSRFGPLRYFCPTRQCPLIVRTHFWETLFLNLVLAILAGSLLSTPPKPELSAATRARYFALISLLLDLVDAKRRLPR